MMRVDGFDEAIIGLGVRCGQTDILVYDASKCIDILHKDMPMYDALEYFEYNILGAYMGKGTPIFVYPDTPLEVLEHVSS